MINVVKKKNIVALMFFLSLVFVLFFYVGGVEKVYAEEPESISYDKYLNVLRDKYGIRFYTPIPRFELVIKDSAGNIKERIFVDENERAEYSMLRGQTMHDIETKATINVGDTIELYDKSVVGSGKKIIAWDWQIYTWDREEKSRYYHTYNTKDVIGKEPVDIPGYKLIFLNVADDYKLPGAKHINFSEYGQWVTTAKRSLPSEDGEHDFNISGWYFTVIKLKVVGADMKVEEPIRLYDKEGKSVESFKRGEEYYVDVDLSLPEGDSDIGLDDVKNPKAKIKYEIKDESGKVILTQTVQTDKILKVGEKITMPQSNKVKLDTNKITVCVNIDPVHKTKGFNSDEKNDKLCKDFYKDGADMGIGKPIEMIKDGVKIDKYKKGENISFKINVAHIYGKEAIGLDAIKNPKATIDIKIYDSTGKLIKSETKQSSEILNAGGKIQIETSKISTTSSKIKVCANINSIHKTKGYNDDNTNDSLCEEFKAKGNDLLILEPELINNGVKVDYLSVGSQLHQIRIKVKHNAGEDVIGLNNTTNPKATVNLTALDGANRTIINTTLQAKDILNPKGTVTLPLSQTFSGATGSVKVCLEINKVHYESGYNDDLTNDAACKTFETVNNYAVSNLKVSPSSVYAESNGYTVNMPVSLTFNLTHETVTDKANLSSYPLVEVKQGNTVVKTVNVLVPPNKTTPVTINLPVKKYPEGNISFTVEVNPKRTEIETKGSDPYKDNKASTSMKVGEYVNGCIACTNYNTYNTWTERFTFTEQKGDVKESSQYISWCNKYEKDTCYSYYWTFNNETGLWERHETPYTCMVCVDPDGEWAKYTYCSVTSSKTWTQDVTFNESYRIDKVMFKSKWSEDNHGGWIDIKNGVGKIKARYGFELKVVTKYTTNRNVLPTPDPYSSNYYAGGYHPRAGRFAPNGYCDWLSRYPNVTPVDTPNIAYAIMPYTSGRCVLLDLTSSSGPWYNNTKEFQLPLRPSISDKNVMVRKIYINETAKAATYNIDLRTAVFNGYTPDNPINTSNKKPMQDCITVKLQILPNDDIKSHIVQ